MIRYNNKKYSIEEVFSIIPINYIPKHIAKKKGIARINVDGALISQYSLRYETFRKSLTCALCGCKASYFRIEAGCQEQANRNCWHFNLYGLNNRGVEILFTKDHIFPKSKGGLNELVNLQTMCARCNFKKGNKIN